MISKARALVQSVLTRFYTVHHNKETFETELVDEVNSARVRGFGETKRRVIEAMDYRIARLTESLDVLNRQPEKVRSVIDDMQSRVDELETIRNYVKGMVIKVEE